MKLIFISLFVANFAEEKKVPPRHPLQRLNRLNEFAEEWLSDNLREKQAERWRPKFGRLSEKFERKYNENECDPWEELLGMKTTNDLRYDRDNPQRAIKQITTGFRKWSEKYICKWTIMNDNKVCLCKSESDKWSNRLNKWLEILICKLVRGCTPAF